MSSENCVLGKFLQYLTKFKSPFKRQHVWDDMTSHNLFKRLNQKWHHVIYEEEICNLVWNVASERIIWMNGRVEFPIIMRSMYETMRGWAALNISKSLMTSVGHSTRHRWLRGPNSGWGSLACRLRSSTTSTASLLRASWQAVTSSFPPAIRLNSG